MESRYGIKSDIEAVIPICSTIDRCGNANLAYSFDGIDERKDIGNN
jgi:hypothetical protein